MVQRRPWAMVETAAAGDASILAMKRHRRCCKCPGYAAPPPVLQAPWLCSATAGAASVLATQRRSLLLGAGVSDPPLCLCMKMPAMLLQAHTTSCYLRGGGATMVGWSCCRQPAADELAAIGPRRRGATMVGWRCYHGARGLLPAAARLATNENWPLVPMVANLAANGYRPCYNSRPALLRGTAHIAIMA
jgi:hypothetical protein